MSVGADLKSLQDLHKTFVTNAQDAHQIKTKVQSSLDAAVWTGKYSSDFRTAWEDYKANLDKLQEALEGAAKDVKVNHNNIAQATGEGDRI